MPNKKKPFQGGSSSDNYQDEPSPERLKHGWGRVINSPKGLRGGNWNNNATNLQVSDRNNAGWTNTNRNNNIGFRPAKTMTDNRPEGCHCESFANCHYEE